MVMQISVSALKELMDTGEPVVLIDCREKDEHDFCSIPGAGLIPLSEFENRAGKELGKHDRIFIHCHHGGRSMRACEYLVSQGFQNVTNVGGGIDAWSQQVDPKVPRY